MMALKKAWSFVKNYWYVPLIAIVSTLGYLLAKKNKVPVDEIIKASKKTHEKEKMAIEQAAEQKVAAKQKVQEEYEKAVKSIEKTHQDQNKKLENKKKKEIKKIVKKHYNEPDKLSKEISDLFGVEHVSENNNNPD
jgi:vacuolar-type H+-ATPase subunit H